MVQQSDGVQEQYAEGLIDEGVLGFGSLMKAFGVQAIPRLTPPHLRPGILAWSHPCSLVSLVGLDYSKYFTRAHSRQGRNTAMPGTLISNAATTNECARCHLADADLVVRAERLCR